MKRAYEIDNRSPANADQPLRATGWLCAAIKEALEESGRTGEGAQGAQAERRTVWVGTGLRELRSFELWCLGQCPFDVHQLHFGHAVRRASASVAPVFTLSNACAASAFGLGLGEDLLRLGEVDMAVVAGCDTITESMFGLLDRANPNHPEKLQPFDRYRRGVVMGEGASAVVLEKEASARRRGVPVLAWLRAVGMSGDGYHETVPDREGLVRAMKDAHERAHVRPSDIDLLLVHGTGTALNDTAEVMAIRELFANQVASVPITAIKSMTGHTSGASGLVGVVTAVECLRRGIVPPTIAVDELLPEGASLDLVRGEPRRLAPRLAQIHAFGFGGVNAVVVVQRSSS